MIGTGKHRLFWAFLLLTGLGFCLFTTQSVWKLPLPCAYAQEELDIDGAFEAGEEVASDQPLTVWQSIVNSGWVEFVIIFCSILGFGLIIEHFIFLQHKKLITPGLAKTVATLLKEGNTEKAMKFCRADKSMLGLILRHGLRRLGDGDEAVKEAVMEAGARGAADLEQKISYLNFIGTVAPMLGLLGTVLGMIRAFNVIAYEEGLGKPGLLAEGVSQALVTTATGLIVAIPVMGFWFYFRGKVRRILVQAEEQCLEVIYAAGQVGSVEPPQATPKPATEEG